MDALLALLGSKSRAEILRLLFGPPGTELHLRELHRRSALSIRPIQQELNNLSRLGLITLRKDGNRAYYAANTEHPLYPEIRGLVDKTAGVAAVLQDALADSGAEIAFLFGSVAANRALPDSDVDLFVIGDVGLRKLTALLKSAADRIGREVNPHVMTRKEFGDKLRSKEHFVSSVMKSKKTLVVGNEDELERLGRDRLAQSP
jgi:predicted nucleotidyltransferase/DNA-binding transcriptional ArsR family regulator